MSKNKFLFLGVLIAVVGFLLRLWHLGDVPPSLHWDEPSWGYNAYSILKTGRDEYGNFMPLIFKAFGDYKSAAYVYLTVIPVAIFGLNEFAVRLAAALFGGISIFLTFMVVKELFKDFKGAKTLGLLSALVLATSPWHYHYSHGAWEVNVLLVFLLLGILFFLKAEKKSWFYYLSTTSFGLCFYVYNSAKLLIPLLGLGLFLFFRQRFFKIKPKEVVLSGLILFLFILPIVQFTFFGGAGGRLKVMSVFSYPRPVEEVEMLASQGGVSPQSWQFRLFHGSLPYFARGVLGRYLNHFSARFLFFEGDWSTHRHSVPNAGVLNHLALFFLPLGVYFLIKNKIKNKAFLWYWLLVAPLPSALSRDTIQATRSFFMVFPLTIMTAFGIYLAFQLIKRLPFVFRWVIVLLLGLGWFFSFAFYLDQFFVHLPKAYSVDWLYGYKEAVNFIKDKTSDYDRVVFTQKYGQPYIYYLFYTVYDPAKYQAQAKLVENSEGDVGYVERIDNIEFRLLYWPSDRFVKNSLYVGDAYEIPLTDVFENESKVLNEIMFLNGELAFRIAETVK
jgi:4-amino-4-deoxy-L-arabinose transferase-like glycosyltransferase